MADRILHVYGQQAPHDNVYISGNREALISLRDLIDTALDQGVEGINYMVNDGEDFTAYVVLVTEAGARRLGLPYSVTECFPENKESPLFPWMIAHSILKAKGAPK